MAIPRSQFIDLTLTAFHHTDMLKANVYVLIYVLAGVAGCDPGVDISGFVIDSNGTGIIGARMLLRIKCENNTIEKEIITRDYGRFDYCEIIGDIKQSEIIQIILEKEGYRNRLLNVKLNNENLRNLRIVMQTEPLPASERR